MRFDSVDLQIFVRACEGGSLTAAARSVHLTLAAVSARLRRMEERQGAPLLVRHARGVVPTSAGVELLRRAREALATMQPAGTARAAGEARAPALRILANSSALARLRPGAIAAMLGERPELRISLQERSSHLSLQALQGGAADIAILASSVARGPLPARRAGPDSLVAVVPLAHRLAGRCRVTLDDLLAWPWVACAPGVAITDHLAWQFGRRGQSFQPRLQVPDLNSVIQLVAAGTGISVLPRAVVERADASLRMIEIEEAWADRDLLVCSRPGSSSSELDAFAARLQTALAQG